MWTKFAFMWKSPTIEPLTCGEVPSKSTWISSPVFVTVATIAMVSSEIPSSSTWSVNDQVPSGSSAIARRVKRSVWSRRSATSARYPPRPPTRSTRASSSRSPIRVAATWASGGRRGRYRARVPPSRAGGGRSRWAYPVRGASRGGCRSPSWWISVLAKPCPPGTLPPMSAWWQTAPTCATHGALVEHRLEQVEVGQVLGPFVRVVGDEDDRRGRCRPRTRRDSRRARAPCRRGESGGTCPGRRDRPRR